MFLLLNDALNLRKVIDFYLQDMTHDESLLDKKDKDKLMECVLSLEDWKEAQEIHGLLYPFWEVTMRMQGNASSGIDDERDLRSEKLYGKPDISLMRDTSNENGAIFNLLPVYDLILNGLERAKERKDLSTNLLTCINLAWKKMKEYYAKSDISKVYLVGAVLDPRIKLGYFKENWPKEWLKGLRWKLDEYTEEFTKAMEVIDDKEISSPSSDIEMQESQSSDMSWGCWYVPSEKATTPIQSQWNRYLVEERVKHTAGFSYRQYWINRQAEYPLLSRMALELLVLPAMSTEVE